MKRVGVSDSGKAFFDTLGQIVATLHNAKILHGDITPENIMISKHEKISPDSIYLIGFSKSTTLDDIDDVVADIILLSSLVFTSQPKRIQKLSLLWMNFSKDTRRLRRAGRV